MSWGHTLIPERDGETHQAAVESGAAVAAEAGKRKLLPKSDGWYEVDSAGVEKRLIATVSGEIVMGKVLIVDSVNGDDATAVRGTLTKPYLTVEGAIADAVSGDVIWILPGTYSLSAGITIPDGVAVRGISTGVVTIQMLNVTANTTLVTMGESARLEDVTLKLTSAGHYTLTGVKFGGTTSATAKLRTAVVTVDNSGAGAGASNVTGVLVQSTGAPAHSVSAIRATTITVNSTGTGTKRGVLVNTSVGNFFCRDCNFIATGGSDCIGYEINIAGGVAALDSGNVSGDTADCSKTAGTLSLNAVDLAHANANGKSFTADGVSFGMVWADPAGLPANATRFLRPGTEAASIQEIKLRMSRKSCVKSLSCRMRTPPGLVNTTTFTIRKNGVDTALTASVSGLNVSAENLTDSVAFADGDDISVKVVTDAANASSDVTVTVEIY